MQPVCKRCPDGYVTPMNSQRIRLGQDQPTCVPKQRCQYPLYPTGRTTFLSEDDETFEYACGGPNGTSSEPRVNYMDGEISYLDTLKYAEREELARMRNEAVSHVGSGTLGTFTLAEATEEGGIARALDIYMNQEYQNVEYIMPIHRWQHARLHVEYE